MATESKRLRGRYSDTFCILMANILLFRLFHQKPMILRSVRCRTLVGCFLSITCSISSAYAQGIERDTAALLAGVGPIEVPAAAAISAAGSIGAPLRLPKAPEGYHLVFKGTDHLPVITAKGNVLAPLSDTKVSVYYQLVADKDPGFSLDLSRIVTVPATVGSIAGANKVPFVIPALKEWRGAQGYFSVSAQSKIVLPPHQKESLASLSSQLQREILEQTGLSLDIKIGHPGRADIYLELSDALPRLGKEGYQMEVGEYLRIAAPGYKGLFWGTRTVLQLLDQSLTIAQGLAADYPGYPVRGLVLDVGRKFFSMAFLRNYVKLLSYYKMNDFQIHLNDNGFKKYFGDNWDSTYAAFRLENDRYPGLTAKDGHYTKQEFRDLQVLGRQYGVLIVPEIDVPAHALSITHAVPEIGSEKYGMDHLDLHNPLTDTVVHNIFKEYLEGPDPVFTGPVVDIGTDEYTKAEAEAFRGFTDRVIGWVQDYGKQVRLWGALTWAEGKTPVRVKGVTMNTWYNGYAAPRAMKKLGYPQISTPDGWLYIVPAAGYYYDYLNLKHLYDKWTPAQVGNVRFEAGDTSIIGGAFAVWNDIVGNGITAQDVTDRVFPALQVLSQKMWGGEDKPLDFKTFDQLRSSVGEGPGLNLRGRLGAYDGPATLKPVKENWLEELPDKAIKGVRKIRLPRSNRHGILAGTRIKNVWSFPDTSAYVELPVDEIGYDYTVSFYLYWASSSNKKNNDPETLFSSKHAKVLLNQQQTGNLGFSREGYDLSFNYRVPENKWVQIIITGTNKGTALFIDGKVQDSLYHHFLRYNDKDKTKMRKVETLVFPLRKLGGFTGKIMGLTIYNRALTQQEIGQLSASGEH